jgi:hypothetical protein
VPTIASVYVHWLRGEEDVPAACSIGRWLRGNVLSSQAVTGNPSAQRGEGAEAGP